MVALSPEAVNFKRLIRAGNFLTVDNNEYFSQHFKCDYAILQKEKLNFFYILYLYVLLLKITDEGIDTFFLVIT